MRTTQWVQVRELVPGDHFQVADTKIRRTVVGQVSYRWGGVEFSDVATAEGETFTFDADDEVMLLPEDK